MKPVRLLGLAITLLLVAVLVAWPSPPNVLSGTIIRTGQLPALTMADMRPHLAEIERITMANGGNRAHGSAGYLRAMDYVEAKLKSAGYETRRQDFPWQREYSVNLIADWPGGDPEEVLMIGAHLDSVAFGPGMNDNGTGSAAILAIALAVAANNHRPARHLRFAWWGTEELGLVGSRHYVTTLPAQEKARIKGYINVDMIGSPNGGHFIYDGDDSEHRGQPAGPPGSEHIEKALSDYFVAINVRSYEVDFEGRSDYAPFLLGGIPAGGLLTGTREIKPDYMAQWWGGTANEAFDPCYHKPCDTIANINETMYVRNTNAVVHAVWVLSQK